jgi:ParB/RepB/Spo0J family partition protein
MEYKEIELQKIFQKENSRSQYRNEDLQELMASMSQDGLLHPIGVAKNGDKFEVLFGNRRYMAAKKLGCMRL